MRKSRVRSALKLPREFDGARNTGCAARFDLALKQAIACRSAPTGLSASALKKLDG